MKITKFRDLSFVAINSELMLAIACDSCGGIGNKEHDIVNTSPEIVGYFTTMVALSEILAIGADPIVIINTLCVEMDKTGIEIVNGIKRAIKPLNISEDIIITGSTEENIEVAQTGIGITVNGIINRKDWKCPYVRKGALAVVLGIPKVGEEVLADEGKEIMSVTTYKKLYQNKKIQDMLPVGSKGIKYEAEEMADTNSLSFQIDSNIKLDLYKSGGPATCAVVAIEESYYEEFKKSMQIPVNRIGVFI